MDLTQRVVYRGYSLNDEVAISPGGNVGTGISGCLIDSVDWSDLDVVQFTEKRALADGLDAGDVYLGGRRIRITGTLYAQTRALLYDGLRLLRSTLSARMAYKESPGDKGYLPLYFSEPTNDIDNWPDGAIPMRIIVLPHRFESSITRNAHGGTDDDALAITWQCLFTAKDPGIYAECPVEISFVPTVNKAGNLTNPGNAYSPLNMEFTVTSHAGVITGQIGDSQFTITIPASTGNRVIRFKGEDKILTFEEESLETLQMAALVFLNKSTWPLMPPGVSAYSIAFSGGLVLAGTTSLGWFWPAFG